MATLETCKNCAMQLDDAKETHTACLFRIMEITDEVNAATVSEDLLSQAVQMDIDDHVSEEDDDPGFALATPIDKLSTTSPGTNGVVNGVDGKPTSANGVADHSVLDDYLQARHLSFKLGSPPAASEWASEDEDSDVPNRQFSAWRRSTSAESEAAVDDRLSQSSSRSREPSTLVPLEETDIDISNLSQSAIAELTNDSPSVEATPTSPTRSNTILNRFVTFIRAPRVTNSPSPTRPADRKVRTCLYIS